jgi:rhodanese-related sulfurtransferase
VVEVRTVNAAEAVELAASGALLLDVRDDHEWQAGRAPGALHVALAELGDHVEDFTSEQLIVCVCRSGGRSKRATLLLVEQGLEAFNLEGGMLAWASEGLDLVGDLGDPLIL